MRAPLSAGAALIAAAAVAWLLTGDGGKGGTAEGAGVATTTAPVVRLDLVERESFEGTLGYSGTRSVAAPAGGTITYLPAEGATIRRGEPLYRVDGVSGILLYGTVPAWRTLAEGLEGTDVRQLEWNLVGLGYDPGREVVIDGVFDSATAEAVRRWQEDRAATEDGVVELGEMVFLPGARRIGRHETSLGAQVPPAGPVLETTSSTQAVTVELEADRQTLVAVGDAVAVEMPDGRNVDGRVNAVGKVAELPEATGADTDAEPTVEVTIALGRRAPTDLDQAPVEVEVTSRSREDVLAVPVTALVALLGGGYAVEIEDGGARRLVAVEPGLSADGYVEVTGEGLREGLRVVVPR